MTDRKLYAAALLACGAAWLLPLVEAEASILSNAISQCAMLDQYCQLTALDANIPLNLVDSDGGHNILEYAAKGVWSQADGKFIFFGQGHLTTPYVITYTAATDTWAKTQLGAAGGFRHSFSNNAINPAMGRWYYKEYAECQNVRRFSIATMAETSVSASNGFGNNICYSGIEYFPDANRLIFASLENGTDWGVMAFQDSAAGSGTWTRIGPTPGTYTTGSSDGQLAYNPVYQSVIFGGSAQTMWKVDKNLNVTALANAPCAIPITNPEFPILTVDPVSGDMILLCTGGSTWKLDLKASAQGVWSQIIATPPPFYGATGSQNGFFSVIATPLADLGGIMFLECGGVSNCRGGQKPRVWFLRHANGGAVSASAAPAKPTGLALK